VTRAEARRQAQHAADQCQSKHGQAYVKTPMGYMPARGVCPGCAEKLLADFLAYIEAGHRATVDA
jgi:hypothetical protein